MRRVTSSTSPGRPRSPGIRMALPLCALILALGSPAPAAPSAEQGPEHPLDGLTSREHWIVYEVMQASGHVDSSTRYATVMLREPPKADVLSWSPGRALRREAFVVLMQGPRSFEAVVDLAGRRLVSWKEIKGVQPNVVESEQEAAQELFKQSPEVIAALKRRGITDLATLECWSASPGYFGTPEEEGRRLVRTTCVDRHGVYAGGGRPIEGLLAVIDLGERKVLQVIDTGPVPVPGGATDYDAESVGKPREVPTPIAVQQPMGPSFTLRGHEVGWQNWSFHFRVDPRRALVVSNVRYLDGGRWRSILYEGSMSELFVPYMDPAAGWYYLTYLDLGEYAGLGLVSSLEPGLDCPGNATYFDSVGVNEHGIPRPRARSACLFERSEGEIAWRHFGEWTGTIESRPQRDLVLRMILTAGNYDYLLDWIFQQNGTIKVEVGATGIVAVKAVQNRSFILDPEGRPLPSGRGDPYGRFVDEHTVAVNHDHFFSFRLDLDVDGPANSLVIDQMKTQRLGADSPRKSIWVVDSRTARVEQEAQLHMSMEAPALWRIINPKARGPMGYPVSYEIRPGHNAASLMAADDFPQRRAGFIAHNLWVTPYAPEELYAAGDYPTQSRGGDGLPAWTAANRPIENTDIVAWYTVGFHHMVRAEDWPVTPTTRHGFEIRPFDFFARNPALDLPKKP